ncbi:MaoC family dehydratase [Chloroflexota bacterium]
MTEGTLLTEEIRKMVGQEFVESTVLQVEKGAMRRFARAIEDPNPLWQDEEYAKKTRNGGIIAPPLFPVSLQPDGVKYYAAQEKLLEITGSGKTGMVGGTEYEWFQPIRPGDEMTVTSKVLDAREREGKLGKMLILVYEITFTNQRGEVAAKERTTAIVY